MIYKGKQFKFTRNESNMRRVLALVESGVQDRDEIARRTSLTRQQVTSALWNLAAAGLIEAQHRFQAFAQGRLPSVYRRCHLEQPERPMAGVAFIFWATTKFGKGSGGRS